MRKRVPFIMSLFLVGSFVSSAGSARADDDGPAAACRGLPSWAALRSALEAAQAVSNGGFGLQ